MCWTARYQDTAKRSWEIYPIGFLVPWSASCSDKNPRCNELQLGMVHELLVQGLCCNFWYGMEGEGLWKFSDIWWRDQWLSFVHMYGVHVQCNSCGHHGLSFGSAYRSHGVIPFSRVCLFWLQVVFGSWNSSRFWWCKWSLPKSWWRSQAVSLLCVCFESIIICTYIIYT